MNKIKYFIYSLLVVFCAYCPPKQRGTWQPKRLPEEVQTEPVPQAEDASGTTNQRHRGPNTMRSQHDIIPRARRVHIGNLGCPKSYKQLEDNFDRIIFLFNQKSSEKRNYVKTRLLKDLEEHDRIYRGTKAAGLCEHLEQSGFFEKLKGMSETDLVLLLTTIPKKNDPAIKEHPLFEGQNCYPFLCKRPPSMQDELYEELCKRIYSISPTPDLQGTISLLKSFQEQIQSVDISDKHRPKLTQKQREALKEIIKGCEGSQAFLIARCAFSGRIMDKITDSFWKNLVSDLCIFTCRQQESEFLSAYFRDTGRHIKPMNMLHALGSMDMSTENIQKWYEEIEKLPKDQVLQRYTNNSFVIFNNLLTEIRAIITGGAKDTRDIFDKIQDAVCIKPIGFNTSEYTQTDIEYGVLIGILRLTYHDNDIDIEGLCECMRTGTKEQCIELLETALAGLGRPTLCLQHRPERAEFDPMSAFFDTE